MKKIVFLIAMMTLVLAACGDNKEEYRAFYTELETPINVESDIQDISSEYDALEADKRSHQEEVNTADRERLTELSATLLENTENRASLVDDERAIMEESASSLDTLRELASDIPVEDYQTDADALIELMEARYTAHGEMMDATEEMLEKELELFTTYGNDDLAQDQIDALLDELSELYANVNETSDSYHESTAAVNEKRSEILDTINN